MFITWLVGSCFARSVARGRTGFARQLPEGNSTAFTQGIAWLRTLKPCMHMGTATRPCAATPLDCVCWRLTVPPNCLAKPLGATSHLGRSPIPRWRQRCEKSCFDLLRIPQDCSHKKGCEKSSSCSWTVILISAFLPQLYASWWPTEVSRRQERTP